MDFQRFRAAVGALLAALLAAGCATQPQPYDYAAFKQSRPRSILVLPPLNTSPDVNATYSLLSQVSAPLAESGYYVFPVALVDETFRNNGLAQPEEIHAVPAAKLREIFGADAALYIEITNYGTSYAIVVAETRVTAAAKLVDLRSGTQLWSGEATASSSEGQNNSGGLVGLLIQAVVTQIVESSMDHGHVIAGVASGRLLSAGRPNGLLYGPRSPRYQSD